MVNQKLNAIIGKMSFVFHSPHYSTHYKKIDDSKSKPANPTLNNICQRNQEHFAITDAETKQT